MVLMDFDAPAFPYRDPETPVLDAVLQRAKTDALTMTMCAGEVIYDGDRFSRVDRDQAMEDLRQASRAL